MEEIITIWLPLLVIFIAMYSFYSMTDYLYKRGVISNKYYGIRIDIVIMEYIKLTIKEKGHIGIWFWPLPVFPILVFVLFVLRIFLFKMRVTP